MTDTILHRKARPLDRRPEAAGGGAQAAPGEGQAAFRAPRLGRPARRIARQGGDGAGVPRRADRRLQHQRRDHDARLRRRAHVRLVHARRRHGARRDDRLAQPHHRARSRRPSACCPGRRASAGCCATNISTPACRSISRRGSCCSKQLARLQGARHRAASSASRSSGICCASPRTSSATTTSARPACAGRPVATVAGRARLFVSLRIQHGPDAAGAVGAGGSVRGDRPAAALDRERMGAGPGRMHLRAARRADSRRQPAPVPHRDAADLPAAWAIFATFMCRPALKGFYSSGWHLHQSLTDAQERGATCSCRSAPARSLSPLGHALSRRAPAACACRRPSFTTPTVNGYRRFRPNSLAPDRATWGYDHRGVMLRVLGGAGRSGDAASRTASASRRPIRISISRRRSSRASTASTQSAIRARRTTEPVYRRPSAVAEEPAGGARRARRRAACSASSSARPSSTISSSSSATRPAASSAGSASIGVSDIRRTSRPSGSRTNISISSDGRTARSSSKDLTPCWKKPPTCSAPPVSRRLYDWDELVQEDRVHRLIYTDPAIFDGRDDACLRRGLGLSRAREPDPEQRTTSSPPSSACARSSCCATRNGKIRALYNRCTHRGTTLCRWNKGNAHVVPLPLSRLDLPQHRQAARRAVAGRLCLRLQGREVQRRAGAARRELSRLHLRHAQYRCAAARSIISAPSRRPIDEWLDRHPGGKVAVCEANRLKYKGNWKLAYDNSCDGYHVVFSHRSLLEMENRLADEANKGMSYYKGSPDDAADVHGAISATAITSRTSGRTSRSAPAGCGRWKARHPAWSITRRSCAAATAPGPTTSSTSPLRAGQHQRVPEPLAARQPHPGVRAGRRSTRPTSPGTAPRWSTTTARSAARLRRDQCAAHAHAGAASRISARSTTSPTSRRSSAGSPASRTSGSTCTAASAFRAASRPTRNGDRSRRRPPTRCSCANTSRNGSG